LLASVSTVLLRRETPQLQHNTVTAQKIYFAFESSAFRSPSATGGDARPKAPGPAGRQRARRTARNRQEAFSFEFKFRAGAAARKDPIIITTVPGSVMTGDSDCGPE
jgi:hypothetical protein